MHVRFYVADQNPHRDRTLGVTSYTDGLLRALATRPEFELDAIVSRSSYVPEGTRGLVLPFRTDRMLGRLVADHLAYAWPSGRPALWHFPKGYLGALSRPRQPVLVTVHDVIIAYTARRYPHVRSRTNFEYWLSILAHTLRRADRIVTVSQHARGQIEEFAAGRRIRLPKLSVTYQGARWEDRAGRAPGPKSDYVLHLASREPHKQTSNLLASWAALQGQGRSLPRLLLVGSLPSDAAASIHRISGIEVREHVATEELGELLERALALVMPSEIEGFGLPVVEAYYRGTPVAYVRDTAMDELLGGIEGGFTLGDPSSLWSALSAISSASGERVATIARSLRERFSWAACAERTAAVYRELAS
jgi:glycosyltransferase involved in cell wall biosynthesis